MNFVCRSLTLQDGFAIHRLIKKSPPLDLNSEYAYCVLADHFGEHCVLAETEAKELAGCIIAYKRPDVSNSLFVWQVAVLEKFRGVGLGLHLLQWLYDRHLPMQVQTTISPTNFPSQRLFKRFAEINSLQITKKKYLQSYACESGDHEEELMYILKRK